jgi:transcription antitermination factor NusG
VGFEVYFPRVSEERRGRRGKRIVVNRPMFACYILLLVTGEWRPALSIPSVTNAVRFSNLPRARCRTA